MTQARLRTTVFSCWIAFWIISTVAILIGSAVRTDQAVGDEQVVPALLTISSIWLPSLTCFATFWFPAEQRHRASHVRLKKDQVVPALAITIVYLTIVLVLVLRPVYWIGYGSIGPDLAPGASFEEHLAAAVNLGLLLSPLALAPTIWLTGVAPAKTKRGMAPHPGSRQPAA